jgi:O-antigen ligase
MGIRLVTSIAGLLLFAVVPSLVFANAYAKGPIYNADFTFGQYLVMVIMPMVAAVGALVMIALYTRQNQKLAAK